VKSIIVDELGPDAWRIPQNSLSVAVPVHLHHFAPSPHLRSISCTCFLDWTTRRLFSLQLLTSQPLRIASLFTRLDPFPTPSHHPPTTTNMSAEEDLIDYSDEELQTTEPTAATTDAAAANGDAKKADGAAPAAGAATKGSYVGIHSTGFRDFLLKPELLRAITDCGFEHPSEG
jgi:hypothetical protein